MPMDNVTLENTQQSISSRDAKSVASVMVNGKWVNLSDTLEQANVKSDVGTVSKQVAEQQTAITSAVAQADSAVAYANDAIEKSRVNSQAIVDINSAVSDAVSDAAVARSDGLRAWNAAQSNADLIDSNYASASAAISSARTEAIAAADEAKASASAAQADIVAARSDVAAVQADVTATRSDVAVAKSDIADTKTNLTSQAKSLSSYAAQASAAGKDITTLKSQAGQLEQDMASTKGDVSELKVSASSASVALSDAAGNISSLQATANSYSAALSDTNSNVASVTATASELETKYADAAGDISQIKADAKGMTQTISDAQGDIAKLKTRADGFDTQFTDTKGNISKLQTDATGTKQTLTNAKSDIAVLQSRADGFDTKFADTAGDINTLKVDASGMQQTLTDAKGDISTLQATATGFKNTLTDAQGNISTLQSDVSGLKKTTSDHAGNIATLQADAKTLTSQMSSAQGDISTLKQTASGISSKVSGMETSLADANGKINDITSNGGGRNLAIGTDQEYVMGLGIPNTVWQDGYAYLKLPLNTTGIEILPQDPHTFFYTLTKGTTYTQTIWFETDATVKGLSGTQITWYTSVGHDFQPATIINLGGNKYKLYSTYTWPGKSDNNVRLFDTFYLNSAFDLSTGTYLKFGKLMLEKGIVSHDWSPAPEDTDARITTNSAAIEQNKKAIALKADQTTVDKTNGDVQQLQAQLKVQSDQIAAKVSSSDLDAKGYATQEYAQSLVTQKADEWNLNLTNLKTDVNAIKTTGGGVNLAKGTRSEDQSFGDASQTTGWRIITIATFDNPQAGQQYTVSVNTKNNGGSWKIQFWDGDSPTNRVNFIYSGNLISTQGKNNVATITWPSGSNKYLIAQLANSNDGGQIFWNSAMLEEGTVAHTWSPAPSDMATVTSVANLSATVDGIQAQVYNSDGSSKITQLSNLIATKVSQGDYNSQITQLKNDINLRVQKGDVVSQINQEAGGNTLIQAANGQGKLALNASSVVFSGSAFIPDAYITTLNADKLRFYDDAGNVATMSAGLKQYDDDTTKRSIILQYSGGYEVHASNLLGSILTMHDNSIRLAVKSNGMAQTGGDDQYSGVYVMTHYTQLSNYRSNGSAPGIYITDDGYTIKGDSTGSGTKWGDLKITSPQIYVTGGNSVSLSGNNAVQMQVNKTHAWLSDGMFHLYKDGDSSASATQLRVEGWAWINGWVEAAGHSQHSALSTKTDIQSVDDDKMLKMVNDTDLATFLYKTDVANGETHRHIGLIIDDVHDVAQYQTPQEFIAPNGVSRDDDNMIGALFGAVKALTKRIKTLESKVG